MKRLIKKSSNNLNDLINDLSDFISKGIDSISGRNNLDILINNILNQIPSVKSSGCFYRGLILNYSIWDFKEKMHLINNYTNEMEQFLEDEDIEEINEKQKEIKIKNVPQKFIDEIIQTCKNEIIINDNYYSFSKSYEDCKNFLFNAAPQAYDGDIYIIFSSNTEGLDIDKLNDKINELDILEETKNNFLNTYQSFSYQKEIICQIKDINIISFNNINLMNNINLYDFLKSFSIYFYA